MAEIVWNVNDNSKRQGESIAIYIPIASCTILKEVKTILTSLLKILWVRSCAQTSQ